MITSAQIRHALETDPDYEKWGTVKMLIEQIVNLPVVLGPERLAETVTFRGLILLQAEVCRLAAATEPDFADPIGTIRYYIERTGESFTLLADKMGWVYDMYEPNPQRYWFSEPVRKLYLAGKLTYAGLLLRQPGLLVPKFPFPLV